MIHENVSPFGPAQYVLDATDELQVTLPPGEYYVGDPCYVLSDPHYDVLMEMKDKFEGGLNHRASALAARGPDGLLVVWDTLCGDGRFGFASSYSVNEPTMGLAVDSGQLSIIDKRLVCLEKLKEYDGEKAHLFDDIGGEMKLTEPLTITINKNGNAVGEDGDFCVLVDADEFADDFDEEDFEDE